MKRLTVRRIVGKDTVFVTGYKSRELIYAVGGKPLWNRTYQAWMTGVRRGSDVIALAELEGYEVSYDEFGGAA